MTANRNRIPTTHETEWFLAARVSQDVLADEARDAREDRQAEKDATALAERLGLTAKDARINHAASGPTEYAQYVDRNDRNRYNAHVGDAVASPAPETVVHSGKRAALRPYKVPRGWVSPSDLLSRAKAAATLNLSGKAWTYEDRLDAASDAVTRTLAAHPCREGYVSPEHASMARLTGLVRNWRVSEQAARERANEDAAKGASLASKVHVAVDGGTVATPMQAARTAIDALQNLGLGADVARRVWPLAYTSARATDAVDGAAIAAELGMTHASYRQAISRARKALPSAQAWKDRTGETHAHACDYVSHLEAVCADTEAMAWDPRALAPETGQADPDWPARSARAYKGTPVDVYRDPTVRTDGRRDNRPDWATSLPPRVTLRLATAAKMRRARETARTAEERRTRRLAAGLPATVR